MCYQIGDTVRLAKHVTKCTVPEGREDNRTAKIKSFMDSIEGGVVMDRDLNGMKFWNVTDLVRVKKAVK